MIGGSVLWAKWRLIAVTLCLAMSLAYASQVLAAPILPPIGPVNPPPSQPADVCTDGPQFSTEVPAGTPGLISAVASGVQNSLTGLSQALFEGIVVNNDFRRAAAAALTIYIAIYGILFTFGMTEITVHDFVTRMIKIGIIAILLSADAWIFFNDIVVRFFNQGTDELINQVTSIAIAGTPINPGACAGGWCSGPLAVLDAAVTKGLSANMWVHLAATAFTSSYGMAHALLMGIALWSFLGTLLTGIWVYLMSMVLRALLFGIAPIFIVCLLFQRTRHLFDGWLNQVVNACLQPILLFTFFAFFLVLVQTSIDKILEVPVCWTEASEAMRGTPYYFHFWRYAKENPAAPSGYEPYGGPVGWEDPFPIDIIDVLIFFILAELGKRFTQVVLMIARDLAGAATDLASMQSPVSDLFTRGGGGGAGGGAAPAAGARVNPGGTRGDGGAGGASGGGSPSPTGKAQATRDQISDMAGKR